MAIKLSYLSLALFNKNLMKKLSNFIFVIITLCFSLLGNAQGKYILKSGDVNGINKWYMGRQIAQIGRAHV